MNFGLYIVLLVVFILGWPTLWAAAQRRVIRRSGVRVSRPLWLGLGEVGATILLLAVALLWGAWKTGGYRELDVLLAVFIVYFFIIGGVISAFANFVTGWLCWRSAKRGELNGAR